MSRYALSTLAVFALGLSSLGCAAAPVPILHDGLDSPRFLRCLLRPNKEVVYSSNYVGEFGGYPPGSKVMINMFSPQRVDLLINNIPHKMFPADGEFNGGDIDGFLHKYFVTSLSEIGIDDPDAPAEEDGGADEGNPLSDPLSAYPDDGSGGDGADEPADEPGDGDGDAAEKAPPTGEGAGFRLDLMKSSTASSVKQGIAAVGMTKEEVYMALGPPIFINFGSPATQLNLETIMDSNRWVYYKSWFGRTFTFGLFSKKVFTFDGTTLTVVD